MDITKIIEIVREVDEILFRGILQSDIYKKGDSDYVTKADIEISKHLESRLKNEYPDIGFISEEEKSTATEGKDYWILDPIDGTTNFMHRNGFCCVSLALYSGGKITLGIIYAPYFGEMFYAEKGGGAYLNGERIRCSEHKNLCDSLGLFEYNPYFKSDLESALDQARRIYSNLQDIRTFGAATLELAHVAAGRADAFLGRYLKPWDFAAGMLLIEEAGGKVSELDSDIDIFRLNSHIVATNGYIHEKFTEALKS